MSTEFLSGVVKSFDNRYDDICTTLTSLDYTRKIVKMANFYILLKKKKGQG